MSGILVMARKIRRKITIWLKRAVNNRWTSIGLQAKMGSIVVFGLAGLLGIFSVLGISSTQQVTDQVVKERTRLLEISAHSMEVELMRMKSAMQSSAGLIEGLLGRTAHWEDERVTDQLDAELARAHGDMATFGEGLYLLKINGEVVATSPDMEATARGVNWREVPAFVEVVKGSDFAISTLPGYKAVAVALVPVYGGGGTDMFLGSFVNLEESNLTSFMPLLKTGDKDVVELVDTRARVIISSEPYRYGKPVSESNYVTDRVRGGKAGVVTCPGCREEGGEQVNEVVVFAPLSLAPWSIVVHQDSREVFATVVTLEQRTILLAFASIAGAIILVMLTTRSVIDPVELLTVAAERISRGDLDTPICCMRGDEIGMLAMTLDEMRTRLQKSMEEVRSLNRELDARVRERTEVALRSQLEAHRTRDELQAIIDGLSDELIVVGSGRVVERANLVAQRRFEKEGGIIGKSCDEIFNEIRPCKDADCHCPFFTVMKTGKTVRVVHHYTYDGTGQERYVDIVASPMFDQDGNVVRVIELMRDVTEERKMEEEIIQRNVRLSILNRVSTTLSKSLELGEILDTTLEEVMRMTGVDIGAIFLQPEFGELELLAHHGLSAEAATIASRFGLLDGGCGGVIHTGQIAFVPDIARYSGYRAESLKKEKLASLLHVPIMTKGCTLGSICIGTKYRREFEQEELDLLYAIGSQIAVAVENARLYSEVQHKERMRGELYKKLISAQEDERKRIARELHDETSQSLTALLFAIEEAADRDTLHEVRDGLENMRDLTVRTLDNVHKIIFDLRPTMLDHLGLVPALRWLADMHLANNGIKVQFDEGLLPERLPAEMETALFRVVQEALNNIARHSAARNVSITCSFKNGTVETMVRDDGIGFDMNELVYSPNDQRGLGIMGMQERVEAIGGEFSITSAPGDGTLVTISIPVTVDARVMVN